MRQYGIDVKKRQNDQWKRVESPSAPQKDKTKVDN